jgi:hypothetical protein
VFAQVTLPHVNWHKALAQPAARYVRRTLAQGLVQYKLGQGLHVYWVQDEQHAEVALQYLQRSMQV